VVVAHEKNSGVLDIALFEFYMSVISVSVSVAVTRPDSFVISALYKLFLCLLNFLTYFLPY